MNVKYYFCCPHLSQEEKTPNKVIRLTVHIFSLITVTGSENERRQAK